MTTTPQPDRTCPACGAPDPRAITYGLEPFDPNDPRPNGGCLRPADGPDWACDACGHTWAAAPPDGPPCPDCDQPLRRTTAGVHCPQCRYTRTGPEPTGSGIEHRGPAPDDEGPWTDEEIDSWFLPVDPAQNTQAHRMRRIREGTIWRSGTPTNQIVDGLHDQRTSVDSVPSQTPEVPL